MRRLKIVTMFVVLMIVFMWSFAYAETVNLPKTGQKACYDTAGAEIPCANTGQDGEKRAGVEWPVTRFTDNNDGTITDNLTGLMWLKDANCIQTRYSAFDNDGTQGDGAVSWQHALDFVAGINAGTYSNCGANYNDWRLPNVNELKSLAHIEIVNTATWLNTQGFINVPSGSYWSSSSNSGAPFFAWYFVVGSCGVSYYFKDSSRYVWPVRAGQVGNLVNLFISKDGAGTGTVTSNQGEINYGSVRQDMFAVNTSVILTATAGSGSVFSGWSEDCSSCGSSTNCVVSMNDHKQCTATFNPVVTLTVTKAGTGTGTVTASSCTLNWSGNTGTCTVAEGTSITLTGTADPSSTFAGWSGDCSGASNTCTVTMNSTKNVTATFNISSSITLGQALDNTSLTWTTSGSSNWYGQTTTHYYGGSAAQSGAITNNQSTCLQTTVTGPGTLSFYWKVSSESGYDYLQFYINNDLQTGSISGETQWAQRTTSITTGSHTLKWCYEKDYSISSGSDAGWVDYVIYTPSSTCTYSISPTTASFNASANTGTVSVTASSSSCTWTAVSNESWITITSGSSGTGNGTVSYSVSANTSTSTRTGTITIAGQTFTVTQAGIQQFALTVTKGGTGSGTVLSTPTGIYCGSTCTASFDSGTVVALIATAASGSTFAGWNGSGCSGTGTCTVTMNSAKNVTATFNSNPAPPPPIPTCTYSISPTSQSVGYQGGTGSVSVMKSGTDCTEQHWTAVSNDSWITVTSGSSGTGNGTVGFTVSENTSTTASRTGTITIAGNTFTVTQEKRASVIIGVDPTSIDFGAIRSGTRATRQVIVTNYGSQTLNVTGVNITGTGAGQYSYNTQCGAVAPNGNCTIAVTYTASSSVASASSSVVNHVASLNISSNDTARPVVAVSLTGQTSATVEPKISVSPSSVTFPVDIEFGNNTVIAISNTGTGTLVIENMAIQGRDRGEFSLSGTCAGIPAGQTCRVMLRTNYTTFSSKEASISIVSNATNSPKVEIAVNGSSRTACETSLTRTSVTVSSSSTSGVVTATVNNEGCWWKATSNDAWITVQGNNQMRQGSGQVSYTVAQNTTNNVRVGSILIGGKRYTIVQAGAGMTGTNSKLKSADGVESAVKNVDTTQSNFSIFTDTAGLWSEDYINAIYAMNLTTGCNQNPLMYCPNETVTRETGAVFLIRGLEGNPSANYCGSSASPFTDVDSGRWSCGHIKRLYERMITRGCSDSPLMYCPVQEMTRWQVAVMIVRAYYGDDFSYPQTPYFSDVLPTDSGFKYIQKLKALGLTKADGQFYPQRLVSRQEMAAFLGRAFLGME